MTIYLNGRTMYPALETSLEQFAKELQVLTEGIKKMTIGYPLSVEPAPVFSPER
jgi:hypothetical protein